MQKSILPISKITFSRFGRFIEDAVKRNESGSVLGLSQREQTYRINQLIKSKPYKTIDLKNPLIDDPEDLKLLTSADKKKVVVLISNADCLLDEKQVFLTYFNRLLVTNNQLCLIFFFQRNITYPWILKLISSYQYLLQNIYFYPVYQKDDLKHFFFYLEKKYKIKIPTKIKNLILKECGSHLWLIKEAVRYWAKTKDKKNIFDHQEMIFRLNVIFDEFEEKEKQTLIKTVNHEADFTQEEKCILDYLKKTNYLSPLLKKFITDKVVKENNLTLGQDNRILFNTMPVDSFFSKTERKGLRFLLTQSNILITREKLGTILWDDGDFSDWALDQFIRRLRNKFTKLGLEKNQIKTKKNQGFIYTK